MYEPFGKQITLFTESQTRLSFIGKEKDIESELGDFGVRKYDEVQGRFTSIDPLWEKYYSWTPYHYCSNNPVMGSDPGGRDEYLMVWATDKDYGHTALAVEDNNDKGTVTIFDFGPAVEVGGKSAKNDAPPRYRAISNYPKDKLSSFDEMTGRPSRDNNPDGVLQIITDDNSSKDEEVKEKMFSMIKANRNYNAASWNCTNYVMEGLKVIDKFAEVYEPVSINAYGIINVFNGVCATPNSLYKKSLSVFDSIELKSPGQAINNRFQDIINE
jgi:RHS repeat-associated protein